MTRHRMQADAAGTFSFKHLLLQKHGFITSNWCNLQTMTHAYYWSIENSSAGYIDEFHLAIVIIDDWQSISLEFIYTGSESFPRIQPHPKYSKALWISSGSVFVWSIMVLPDLSFGEYMKHK